MEGNGYVLSPAHGRVPLDGGRFPFRIPASLGPNPDTGKRPTKAFGPIAAETAQIQNLFGLIANATRAK